MGLAHTSLTYCLSYPVVSGFQAGPQGVCLSHKMPHWHALLLRRHDGMDRGDSLGISLTWVLISDYLLALSHVPLELCFLLINRMEGDFAHSDVKLPWGRTLAEHQGMLRNSGFLIP